MYANVYYPKEKQTKKSLFSKCGFQLQSHFSTLSFKAFKILYINFIHILISYLPLDKLQSSFCSSQ